MSTRLGSVILAGALVLTACSSPTGRQQTSDAGTDAAIAGEQAARMAPPAAEVATAGTGAGASVAPGASGAPVPAAIDADADPIQQAYEQGKADAAAALKAADAETGD